MEHKDSYNIIITAFRKGDDKAFAKIYDIFFGPLYYFVQRIIDNTGESEEITADSFFKLWRQRADFQSFQTIKSFLYTTSRNACIDLIRNKKRQAQKKEHLDYFLIQDEDYILMHDEIRSEVMEKVVVEIEKLPDQCAKIFKFSYLLGFKNAEIAREMGLTLQTVKNQKTKAVKLLKSAVASHELQLLLLLSSLLAFSN